MNLDKHKNIAEIDPAVTVFHVGGRGEGFGPAKSLLQLGKNLSLTIFEADIETGGDAWKEYETLVADYANRYGIKLSVIPRCLSNFVGKHEFHINVMPDCSSLLKMNPSARNYQRRQRYEGIMGRIVWGEICQPTHTIEIDVTTLDALSTELGIPQPDFLSLDTQGAEYDILEGASKAIEGDLLGVIAEGEFAELYEGQKLFVDQHAFLKKRQFRLFDFLDTEYWYSGPITGKGALTVTESLFLREYRYFIDKYQEAVPLLSCLAKLAIIAYCFNHTSYTYEIMEYIMDNWRPEWDALVTRNNGSYIPQLEEFYRRQKQEKELPTYSELIAQGLTATPRHNKRTLKSTLRLIYNLNLKMIVEKLKSL